MTKRTAQPDSKPRVFDADLRHLKKLMEIAEEIVLREDKKLLEELAKH